MRIKINKCISEVNIDIFFKLCLETFKAAPPSLNPPPQNNNNKKAIKTKQTNKHKVQNKWIKSITSTPTEKDRGGREREGGGGERERQRQRDAGGKK